MDTGTVATSAIASGVGVIAGFFVDHLGLALAGWVAGRSPVVYHNQVIFRLEGSDLAYGGGMVLSLIAGAFFLTLYPGSRRHDAARITMLWVILHCFRQGLTQLGGLPFDSESNVARAFAVFDLPAGVDLVIAAAGLIGLLAIALASAPAFLAYAPRQSEIDSVAKRLRFTARLALIPGVIGPLLVVPVFIPDNETGLIPSLALLGLFTVATVLASLGAKEARAGEDRVHSGWSWLPLAWLVAMAIVFQLLLRRGVMVPPSLGEMFVDPL